MTHHGSRSSYTSEVAGPWRTRHGSPGVIVTPRGVKTGCDANTRDEIEHDGDHAMIASLGGAPRSTRYHNITAYPRVELQDGATSATTRPESGR